MKKKVTIKDIAERAQVSRGTVDRVIHNRGNVAPEIEARILEVMDELKYERNIIASTLAYNRTFHIGVLIPSFEDDPYWEQPKNGIIKALKAVEHYGITVSLFCFDQYDTNDFVDQGQDLLDKSIDGILVAPVFFEESMAFLAKCEEKKIPYVQMNTYLDRPDLCNLGYIGQDSYQTGKLAANLLNLRAKPDSTIVILHLEEKVSNAHHLVKKEKGLRDYFDLDPAKSIEIVQLSFAPFKDEAQMYNYLDQQLGSIPNLAGIFVSTSRIYLLENYLSQPKYDQVTVVGVDLIEKNIDLLLRDKIDFLINQNPLKQGYYGIIKLTDHLVKQSRTEKIRNVPLDIVLKENYQYYLEATEELHILV